MGGIISSSLASGVGVGFTNVSFSDSVQRLERKPLLIGTYDPSKTAVVPEEEIVVGSAEETGSIFGFGFPLHRITKAFFRQYPGFRVTLVPQEEVAGTQATGTISTTGTATESKELSLFIAGDYVPVSVVKDDTGAEIATKIAAAINADKNLPVTAVVNGVTDTQVDVTAKDTSTYGNGVIITHSLYNKQAVPSGVVLAIVDLTGGTGVPDIQDALDAIGTNDQQNQNWYTGVVHTYGQHEGTMNAISAYNGIGNEKVGNYKNTVSRPFQCIMGDTVESGDSGLDDLITIGDGRTTDRTNCIIAAPGSPNHPCEIAAQTLAIRESTAIDKPESTYVDKALIGVFPGLTGTRWTDDYDTGSDLAVKSGISTTDIFGGNLVIKDLITFYHPEDVPDGNNIYRSMRNNAITQNVCNSTRQLFSKEEWKNITIVSDVSKVTDSIAKQKARDIKTVAGALCGLATKMMGVGWLFDDEFTKTRILSDLATHIQIRDGGKGFNNILPLIYSGEGGIINTEVQADISLAIFF